MPRWWCAAGGGLKRVVLLHTSRTTPSSSPASYHTLQAIPREYTGNRISARDRAQGRIPTVVFSQHEEDPTKPVSRKQLLTTERKQINSILKSVELPFFCTTTFQLQIRAGAGSLHLLESGTVLPIKIHRDPNTGNILNLVLVWANQGSEINVNVPVVFKGEAMSPGLNKGGYLQRIREHLRYQCPVEHIPPKIEVDVSNLDVGNRVYVKDLEVHPSLKLLSRNKNIPLCKVRGTKPKVLESETIKMEESKPVAA